MNTQENTENKKERKTYTNYDIFPGKIKLVSDDGISVIDRDVAIEMAKSQGMSLVQVGYNKNSFPKSICKILDIGKLKYEQKKREKENARKSRITNAEAKEIVFSIRIDEGDFNHKVSQIMDFLTKDFLRVKITVKLSKRELSVKHMAKDLIKRVLKNFDSIAVLDGTPVDYGRIISCTLRPIQKSK